MAIAVVCNIFFGGGFLDNPDQQFKRRLVMPGVGIFVRWSLALEGSIGSLDKRISFKLHIYIYTQTCVYHRASLSFVLFH